jgi:predicted NBD/HSP70 family sugar kinase
MREAPGTPVIHGSDDLGEVVVDTYNAELRDGDGFIGDRASNRAFRAILDEWRDRLRGVADDPLGKTPTEDLSKKKLDKLLVEGKPEAAAVVQSAIEDFAAELTTVIERFLKIKAWQGTERIVVGGGLRESRVGELVIGRASVRLKAAGHKLDVVPIHHHPDEAGLIGAVHLAPGKVLEGHDGILAVDIGGSNVRAGIVELHAKKNVDPSKCAVSEMDLWRHADDKVKPTRDQALERIGDMLKRLVKWADKHELDLAPFVGVACPGIISADGQIERGGQNLPGNWESSRFNLPDRIAALVPKIHDDATMVLMHNDAVVQGLSELPYLGDFERWGVLTIGTGLGNARFTNRKEGRSR